VAGGSVGVVASTALDRTPSAAVGAAVGLSLPDCIQRISPASTTTIATAAPIQGARLTRTTGRAVVASSGKMSRSES
jgi:hypothetical protein